MGQNSALGYAGGPPGINNQRHILRRVTLYSRWLRFCVRDHIIKKKMTGLVIPGFGNFPSKTAKKRFDRRQIGFDPADHHRLHVGTFNCLNSHWVKLGMIHTKDGFGTGVF